MASPKLANPLRATLARIDPRRSFGAAAMWLIVALAATFSIAAAVWVGGVARRNVLEQHVRRLALETDQMSSDLGQALTARLTAVRAAEAMTPATERDAGDLPGVFAALTAAYPTLDWIAVADARGTIVAARQAALVGTRTVAAPWFSIGLRRPWLGIADEFPPPVATEPYVNLGELAIPLGDGNPSHAGVVITHVRWRRAAHHPERLTDEPDPRTTAEYCVLDAAGVVLVGPKPLVGKPWPGLPDDRYSNARESGAVEKSDETPRFERLPDGRRVLVAGSALAASDDVTALGWRVQLSEPNARVFQRADALTHEILWISLGLGFLTALAGIIGAQHLTRRLRRLAVSVTRVGQDPTLRIEPPRGADEVARLGAAFAALLHELSLERHELERRVAVRTREVERLADESRYAAIVRERLTIARDLHDTLAHSMMAILSEIRFLRKLQSRDPQALTKELARAEQVAQEGLQEARRAITQMRSTAVRETGLGPALEELFERFLNLTGLSGDFQADAAAARFGDDRAETILRMAREALRNVERHARASRVAMRLRSIDDTSLELRIEDDGVGFDPRTQPSGHYGIIGLREQAELIGARLSIESRPNQGTIVSIVLHLAPIAFNQPVGAAH